MVTGQISKYHQTVQGSHSDVIVVCWGQELFMYSLMIHIQNAVTLLRSDHFSCITQLIASLSISLVVHKSYVYVYVL